MHVKLKYFSLLSLYFFCASAAFADNPDIFTGNNANTTIAEALAKAGAGDNLKLHINQVRDDDMLATAEGGVQSEVSNLTFDREHNSWKATLLFRSNGRDLTPVALSGNYEELKQVPVLKRQIRAGETIASDDIMYDSEPAKHTRGNIITEANDLVGKAPKHTLTQGRPIRQDEIANPAILLKGSRVTMVYRSQNLEIRTLGEALDSGAKGDVVRIRNLASKAIIDAVVISGDVVRVSSPESSAAEAM